MNSRLIHWLAQPALQPSTVLKPFSFRHSIPLISVFISSSQFTPPKPSWLVWNLKLIGMKRNGMVSNYCYHNPKPGNQLTKLKSKQINSFLELNFFNSLNSLMIWFSLLINDFRFLLQIALAIRLFGHSPSAQIFNFRHFLLINPVFPCAKTSKPELIAPETNFIQTQTLEVWSLSSVELI